jgi:hypothetical protein
LFRPPHIPKATATLRRALSTAAAHVTRDASCSRLRPSRKSAAVTLLGEAGCVGRAITKLQLQPAATRAIRMKQHRPFPPSPCGGASALLLQTQQRTSAAFLHVPPLLCLCAPSFSLLMAFCLLSRPPFSPRNFCAAEEKDATFLADPLLAESSVQKWVTFQLMSSPSASTSLQVQKRRARCSRWRVSSAPNSVFAVRRILRLCNSRGQSYKCDGVQSEIHGVLNRAARSCSGHALARASACPLQLEYGTVNGSCSDFAVMPLLMPAVHCRCPSMSPLTHAQVLLRSELGCLRPQSYPGPLPLHMQTLLYAAPHLAFRAVHINDACMPHHLFCQLRLHAPQHRQLRQSRSIRLCHQGQQLLRARPANHDCDSWRRWPC